MRMIKRDSNGLAHTKFCKETSDGGIDLKVGLAEYQVAPEEIADAAAFAETWAALSQKRWFTSAIADDFTNVVTACWLAKARGWI